MPVSGLDFLQRPPKMLDILVHLLEKDETTVSDLLEDLNLSASTYYAAVRRLFELGFVFKREERVFPRHVCIGLTRKGREIAERLRPISEMVESTLLGLKSELGTLEMKERTEKENIRMLEILIALMDLEFTAGEWDDAESHATRALDIASALDDDISIARALRLLGEVHHRRELRDKAEKEFTESLKIHMRMNDLAGASEDRYFLGAIKERRGDLEGAHDEFEKSLGLADSARDEILKSRAILGIGRILALQGKCEESLKRFKESIEIFERLDEVDELPRAYTSAGSSAFYLDVNESLKWHEKCVKLAKTIGDVRMLGYGLSNAAGCYIEKKETKKARQNLEDASEIAKKLDEKKMIVGVNIQMGIVYWREERWTYSERYFYDAIDMARKSSFEYELGDALLNSGLMNIDRGRKHESKRQLKEALEIFETVDNQAKVNEIREALSQISR